MKSEKRLIDADALIKHLGEEPMVWCDGEAEIQERDDWRRFKAYIEAQDTIDAVVLPCQKGAVLIRDGQKCVADHWNILLTAFNEEHHVRLFDVEEAEAALAKMDGDENG